MASTSISLGPAPSSEDVLAYLPISTTTEYSKDEVIYGLDRQSDSIYLLVSGHVAISQTAEDGNEVLLEVLCPDEIFGESAFLDNRRCEQATAMEKTTVMSWTLSGLEEIILKRPRLSVALLQISARRNADFASRIQSLIVDTIQRRLARSLIGFSERLGTPVEDGVVQMMPLTHEMLSRYVGTSREIVTQYMVEFRKLGYVRYSRRGIFLSREALRTALETNNIHAPTRRSPAVEQMGAGE